MCLQRRRLYDNKLIITLFLVRRFCRFCSRICTTFHFSCRVQFSFLHRQYTILNAIKQCYFRNRKLKKQKKNKKIMTFTVNDQILQFNFIFEIYFDSLHTGKNIKQCLQRGTVPFRLNSERKIGFFSGHSCLWKVRLLPIKSEQAVQFTQKVTK